MLHADARAGELAVARIAVFGVWFVLVASTPVLRYTALPPEVFTPWGVGKLVPVTLLASSAPLLIALKTATLVGCLLCVLGTRPWVPTAMATCALLLVHDAVMKSIGGFVNHAQIAVLYAALILAIFPSADALSVRARPRSNQTDATYAVPMLLGGLVLTTAYAFVGIRRIVRGGVEVFTGDAVVAWTVTRSLQYSAYDFDLGVHAAGASGLVLVALRVGLFVVTALEALSPLALRYRRFRAVWLTVMIPFHVSTLFTMNIFFWENLVLTVVFVTGLPTKVVDTVEGGLPRIAALRKVRRHSRGGWDVHADAEP